MTSRPAAPELLEAASRELRRIRDDNLRIDEPDFHTMTGAIEELERRLSLAQTEIKGHMRVAKEVRVDALEEAANACEALGRTPRNGVYMASARACADAIRVLKDRV